MLLCYGRDKWFECWTTFHYVLKEPVNTPTKAYTCSLCLSILTSIDELSLQFVWATAILKLIYQIPAERLLFFDRCRIDGNERLSSR